MKKEELISKLEQSRADFLEIITRVPGEYIEQPGVIGSWSVKDILVHLTRWEAEIIKLIWQVRRGIQPTTAHFDQFSVDETNERWYQESGNRSLNIVMSDFLGVRNQTIRRVKELSPVELNDPNHFNWSDGKPLWEWIADDSMDHETEHGDQIKSWLAKKGLEQ
ncbi:MAG: ClbS/DfsB family four-helix bundle protein [Anaerolineales bacterium]